MPGIAAIFCFTFFSFCAAAQKPGGSLEKLGLKNILSNLSYIPAKSFNSLDYSGNDSVSFYGKRIASVHGFYISQTEVTNREYREFVFYVRDSIAHSLLLHFMGESRNIDWSKSIDWSDSRLETLMLAPEERIFGRKEMDPGKISYAIDFFGKKETVSIYPDTLVWIRDIANSNNEPLVQKYFSSALFDNYPVVGVNLKQAMAFCEWKTGQVERSLKAPASDSLKMIVRLPTSAEWESASFELKDSVILFNGNKGYNCNFGTITNRHGLTMKGFKDDGYLYTSPVKSFPAGPHGLFDMKGNVAEWTSTAREEIMGAEVKPEKIKSNFVVKGGGWNSTPFYLQAGVCQFFPFDEVQSFVGFRYLVYVFKK